MCEKIAQLTQVVSNLHSETEDFRERERELEEEHYEEIELCRANAASKILETHAKWRMELTEKERFAEMAKELEDKQTNMQSTNDDKLSAIITKAEEKQTALTRKMKELEEIFAKAEEVQTNTLSETKSKLYQEIERRQTSQEEKIKIEQEKIALEKKMKDMAHKINDYERKLTELEMNKNDLEHERNEQMQTSDRKYNEAIKDYKILETKQKEAARAQAEEHEVQITQLAEKFKRKCEELEGSFQNESLKNQTQYRDEVVSVREALEMRLRRQVEACDVLRRDADALKETVQKERLQSKELHEKLQNETDVNTNLQNMVIELREELDIATLSRSENSKQVSEQLNIIKTLEKRIKNASLKETELDEKLQNLEYSVQKRKLELEDEKARTQELESVIKSFELRHVQTLENSMAISKQQKEELFQLDMKLREEHKEEIELLKQHQTRALQDTLSSRQKHVLQQQKIFERETALAREEMEEKLRKADQENKTLKKALEEHELQASKFEHVIKECQDAQDLERNRHDAERRAMSLEAEASKSRELQFREDILNMHKENNALTDTVLKLKDEMKTKSREAHEIFNEEKRTIFAAFDRSLRSSLVDAENVFESEKRKIAQAHDQKIRKINEDFERKLSQEIDDAIETIKGIHAIEINELVNMNEKREFELKENNERSIREVASERDENIASLTAARDELVSELKKEIANIVKANELKISGMETYFESQKTQMIKENEEKLELSLRSLESRLENIRNSGNDAWAKSLEELKLAYETDVQDYLTRESTLLSEINAINDRMNIEKEKTMKDREKLIETNRDFVQNLKREHRSYVDNMKVIHKETIEEERLSTKSAIASFEKWKLKYNARESRDSDIRKIRMLKTALSKITESFENSEKQRKQMQEDYLKREISLAKGIGFSVPTLRTKEGIVTIDRNNNRQTSSKMR